MQRINKTISLEEFKTRYPIIYPAWDNGLPSYVTPESLKIEKNGNYNKVPLNVNIYITGYYKQFTTEMEDEYNGSTFNYTTIKAWYKEFNDYYSLLYSNSSNKIYSSALEYYQDHQTIVNDINDYISLDNNFKLHGGEKFYNWLNDNYFGLLNFKYEYTRAVNEDKVEVFLTQKEWDNCIDNLPSTSMFYVDVYEFYNQISDWHTQYKDIKDCKDVSNCCDCVLYYKYGGETLYNILKNWLKRISNKIESNNKIIDLIFNDSGTTASINKRESLIPNAMINIGLSSKVENLGDYSLFATKFVAGREYNIGNVCIYDDNVYILKSGVGYVTDTDSGVKEFDTNGWVEYLEFYRTQHIGEYKSYDDDYMISGRTSSILNEFQECSIDAMGNVLPGKVNINYLTSTCAHPAENSYLNLPYTLGSVRNIKTMSNGQYCGDVLYMASFYVCDSDGSKIDGSIVNCYEGDNLMSAIEKCLNVAMELSMEDYILNVDFVYYKDTVFYFGYGNKVTLDTKKLNDYIYEYGVKCVEHCTLNDMSYGYYLNESESYPIRFYNIEYDTEETQSELTDDVVNTNMCDFFIAPGCYGANANVVTAGPMFRREEILGFTGPQKVVDNIYIDRGYSTVLDRHLKLSEVTSLDTLVRYGNKSFDIINIEEENNNNG